MEQVTGLKGAGGGVSRLRPEGCGRVDEAEPHQVWSIPQTVWTASVSIVPSSALRPAPETIKLTSQNNQKNQCGDSSYCMGASV